MKKERKDEFKEGNKINTAVDVAIFNTNGEILLGQRLTKAGYGTWGFPGGHLRTKEKINECAKREIKEEVGNEAEIETTDEVLAIRENTIKPYFTHHLTVIIKGKYMGGRIRVNEPEKCREWKWFKLDNLPLNLFSGVKETLSNYRQREIKVVTDWK